MLSNLNDIIDALVKGPDSDERICFWLMASYTIAKMIAPNDPDMAAALRGCVKTRNVNFGTDKDRKIDKVMFFENKACEEAVQSVKHALTKLKK